MTNTENEKDELHLGRKLAAAMKAKGVKQIQVARHFGVSPPTVSADWIKYGRIAKKHIPGLVAYFGRPYEYWLIPERRQGCDKGPGARKTGFIRGEKERKAELRQSRKDLFEDCHA